MTQSWPIRAPPPTTTFGWTMVPAPIAAPGPTVTNGPIEALASMTASGAMALSGSMPGRSIDAGANSDTACANAEYGSSARSTAHDEGGWELLSGPRITADAR